jgi:hypothetical protein
VWSTLDLGKTLPQTGSEYAHSAASVLRWLNSSHQGLTHAAPEPSRGLDFRAGDEVLWRLLVRQGLYEVYFAKKPASSSRGRLARTASPVFYFGAAYGAAHTSVACVSGQALTSVELHGAFAQAAVTVHALTLDTHDWPTCVEAS